MQPQDPQNQRPLMAILHRIWNALHRRPIMKLAALLVAVLFWVIVIASDPTLPIERTILNAVVTVSGQETLRSRGLTVMDDLSSGTITVKMRVQVKQADYDKATAEYFTPRLELAQQITHEGRQQVFFSITPNNYGTVLSFEPEYVELDVEAFTSRSRVPIVVKKEGEASSPLWVSGVTTEPSQVAVSGPKSLVDMVSRAIVTLPLEGLSEARPEDSLAAEIVLQDASENPITSSLLRVTSEAITVDSVRIDMDVYPMRDIPVDTKSAITGVPAHGYTLQELRITPADVSVAASTEMLADIEALYVASPLDISSKTEGTYTETIALRGISGTAHIATQEVTVEADIVPATHVHVYNNLPILIMGQDASLLAKISHSEIDVFLRGEYDKVQGLSQDDITLFVDATDLAEGVHLVEVQSIVNGTDAYAIEPELTQVTLTLTKESASD